jgi:hypothetical protein
MSQADRPKPYAPHGAVDGIVCDTTMAKNMSFACRFGNSCGMPFNAAEFFKAHRQYAKFAPYVLDRPSQPWTDFTISEEMKKPEETGEMKKLRGGFKLTKKSRKMRNKTKKTKFEDEE